uniref:hypothetical protein n=1 Tax=Jatropha curcas TaxID=180498 RepID=UPI0027A14CA2|nr:hypothetical protein QLP06_mgp093 [Jatropha curcas]WFG81146.1 hypothetical protein [Jatropha curcas]
MKYMLSRPIKGRVGKWTLVLIFYTITIRTPKGSKGESTGLFHCFLSSSRKSSFRSSGFNSFSCWLLKPNRYWLKKGRHGLLVRMPRFGPSILNTGTPLLAPIGTVG